jgi:hypothetical protein
MGAFGPLFIEVRAAPRFAGAWIHALLWKLRAIVNIEAQKGK